MTWRLHHPSRRAVKIHNSMHLYEVRAEKWFHRLPHGLRHTILRPSFWLGITLSFPLEHLLWEKAWPFNLITRWLGL